MRDSTAPILLAPTSPKPFSTAPISPAPGLLAPISRVQGCLKRATSARPRSLRQREINSPACPAVWPGLPAWTGNVSPVSDYKTRSEFQALGLNGVDPPKRVETVSWLVGGPRSNRGSAEESAPPPADSTA